MKEIQLTRGMVAIVDDEDYGKLCRCSWSADKIGRSWYAVRCCRIGGKLKKVYMHREIMDVAISGALIDHIDMDGLNNRKVNLRLATKSQNAINKRPQSNSITGITGVTKVSGKNRWVAQLSINGSCVLYKRFDSLGLAIDARISAEKKYHKEFTPQIPA